MRCGLLGGGGGQAPEDLREERHQALAANASMSRAWTSGRSVAANRNNTSRPRNSRVGRLSPSKFAINVTNVPRHVAVICRRAMIFDEQAAIRFVCLVIILTLLLKQLFDSCIITLLPGKL